MKSLSIVTWFQGNLQPGQARMIPTVFPWEPNGPGKHHGPCVCKGSTSPSCIIWDKLFNFPKPSCPHIWNEDNSSHIIGLPYKGNEGMYLIMMSALLPGFWAGDDLLGGWQCSWQFCGTLTSTELPLGIVDLGEAHLCTTWIPSTMVRHVPLEWDGLCSDLAPAPWLLSDLWQAMSIIIELIGFCEY